MINAYIKKCFTVLILCITAVMLSNEVRHMSETNQLFTLNITSDRFKLKKSRLTQNRLAQIKGNL